MIEKPLSVSEEKFCRLMITAKSELHAYKDSFEAKGMSDRQINNRAWKLLDRADIQERLAHFREQAAGHAVFTLAQALREFADIATADPNEIIQHRRVCCRYCHGEGHRRMWDWSEYADELAKALTEGNPAPSPANGVRGGVGYDKRKPPHPDCPECFGDGVGDVWVADTRDLRGKAAKLYAGVELTKHGIKIHMRDQDAALKNITAILGGFVPKQQDGKTEHNPAEFLRELGMMLPN